MTSYNLNHLHPVSVQIAPLGCEWALRFAFHQQSIDLSAHGTSKGVATPQDVAPGHHGASCLLVLEPLRMSRRSMRRLSRSPCPRQRIATGGRMEGACRGANTSQGGPCR